MSIRERILENGEKEPEMFYSTIDAIPLNVRDELPENAWSIYFHAFNNAWRDYKSQNLSKLQSSFSKGKTREEIAHEAAMSAAQWPGLKPTDAAKVK